MYRSYEVIMISGIKRLKRYCNKYCEIENYDKAVNDPTTIWECHHRAEIEANGIVHSIDYLIKNNLYYHQNPEDLIFLTQNEHRTLHNLNRSKQTKDKIRDGHIKSQSTEFSRLFYSHYGKTSCDDKRFYYREKYYYKKHNHFSDEV